MGIQKNTPQQISARDVLLSKMWRLALVFSQVSLCMSAPQVCTNHAGESVPCANLLLNNFGLPVFDMIRVFHRERPCFNNEGGRVACAEPGAAGLRMVSNEGWCKEDADCWSRNCCGNYCKPQSWNCDGGFHIPPTEKPHIQILKEGQECTATVFTAPVDPTDPYSPTPQTKMCSQHPYPLLCHKPDGSNIGTCRECGSTKDCQSGYVCMDHEKSGQERICLPDKCSDTKKCHHGLQCRGLWSKDCVLA